MTYKIILAVIGGFSGDNAVLETARSFAVRFGAHIDVLHVRADPYTLPYLDAGVAPSVTASLLAAVDAQIEARRNVAWDNFVRWREGAGLSEAEPPSRDPARPTIRWIERKGSEAEIGAQGRFADLIVLEQPSREQENVTTAFLAGSFESALFGTPRPAVVVPAGYDGRSIFNGPVVVAWNGSLEADRALAAALPLIASAGSAVVFIGEEPCRHHVPDIAGLKTYLKRHAIAARIAEARVESAAVGSYLLKAAQDSGCGSLVMGAYTHSRLREFVLGGATRGLLESMTVPVLMSH